MGILDMGILENAKQVATAVHEIQNLELYGRVLNLHAGIIDLGEDNRKLLAELEDLNNKPRLREKMTFKEPFYYQDGDETPFCSACWEGKQSAIHLHITARYEDSTWWTCSVCKTTCSDKTDRRAIRRAQSVRGGPNSWMSY
jgi:hypothetical protein